MYELTENLNNQDVAYLDRKLWRDFNKFLTDNNKRRFNDKTEYDPVDSKVADAWNEFAGENKDYYTQVMARARDRDNEYRQSQKESRAVDWFTGKSAKSVEQSQQNESRKRIESGDQLAELGADDKTIDVLKRNRAEQGIPTQYGSIDSDLINDVTKIVENPLDPGNLLKLPGMGDEPAPLKGEPGTPGTRDYVGNLPGGGMNPYDKDLPVPVLYTRKVDLDINGNDFKGSFDKSKYEDNIFATSPEQQSPEDLLKNQQNANLQTFDQLKRGGSFGIETAAVTPFGGQDPTTAFVKDDVTSLSDVSKFNKGGTIFRWA